MRPELPTDSTLSRSEYDVHKNLVRNASQALTFSSVRLAIGARMTYDDPWSVSNQACPHHAGMMSVPPLRSPFGTDPLRSMHASRYMVQQGPRLGQCAIGDATEARQPAVPSMIVAGNDFNNTSGTRSTAARRGP